MAMASVVVYLDEEIERFQDRILSAEEYLKINPPFSIYKRVIDGRVYYYKKFWDKEKKCAVSKLIGNEDVNLKAYEKEQEKVKENSDIIKDELKRRKVLLKMMKRQIKLAREALAFEGERIL